MIRIDCFGAAEDVSDISKSCGVRNSYDDFLAVVAIVHLDFLQEFHGVSDVLEHLA